MKLVKKNANIINFQFVSLMRKDLLKLNYFFYLNFGTLIIFLWEMDHFATQNIEEPVDLVKLCLNTNVKIKLRHGRELKGKLHVNNTI